MQAESYVDDIHDRSEEKYQEDKEPDVHGVLPVLFISPQICPENDTHQGQTRQNEINKLPHITLPEVQWRIKLKTPADVRAK